MDGFNDTDSPLNESERATLRRFERQASKAKFYWQTDEGAAVANQLYENLLAFVRSDLLTLNKPFAALLREIDAEKLTAVALDSLLHQCVVESEDPGRTIEVGKAICGVARECQLLKSNRTRDPPPEKWSDLNYVF